MSGRPTSPRSAARRAGVLFEIVLSIALFVAVASFTLAATGNVLSALHRAHRGQELVDVARSTMAELEMGTVTVADLRAGARSEPGPDGSESPWVITVDTRRSPHPGLTLVELTVAGRGGGTAGAADQDDDRPRFTLRQLLRLVDDPGEAFETDELLEDLPAEEGP